MTTPRIKLIWVYDEDEWQIDTWDSHDAPLTQRQRDDVARFAREIHAVLNEEANNDPTRQTPRTGRLPPL